MSISIRDFAKKFVPKVRAYKILNNKLDEVKKESILIWKKSFGFLLPSSEEEKEEEGRDVIELYNQEDYDELESLEEQVRNLVDGSEQQNVVTMEYVLDSSP